eukprot:5567453-Pyramimonas_sp.AAC.1
MPSGAARRGACSPARRGTLRVCSTAPVVALSVRIVGLSVRVVALSIRVVALSIRIVALSVRIVGQTSPFPSRLRLGR